MDHIPLAKTPMLEESLNFLLFTVGGISYAVDTDQVAAVGAYHHGVEAVWFHHQVDGRNQTVHYVCPVVMTLKCPENPAGHATEKPNRVIVDSLEDMMAVSRNDISLLPTLLASFALRHGVWGVIFQGSRMILLLDFLRWPAYQALD